MIRILRESINKYMPRRVLSFLKLLFTYPNFMLVFRQLHNSIDKKRFILFGTPVHGNLGDHLIAIAEIKYLNTICLKEELIEIPTEVFVLFKKRLASYIKEKDIIFISGGGWMGTLWPDDELIMQNIISEYRENKIIVFPQTIFYDNSSQHYEKIIKSAKNTYKLCSNLTICVRDRKSYNFAVGNLGIEVKNCFLLPDIALYYSTFVNKEEVGIDKKTILLCLRNDREKIISENIALSIIEETRKLGYTCKLADTVISNYVGGIQMKNRLKGISNKINEFSNAELIITDRLHAMLFSVIAGTPCIALNNGTSKVHGVYDEWLKEIDSVIYIDTTDVYEWQKYITRILQTKKNILKRDWSSEFDSLTRRICYE